MYNIASVGKIYNRKNIILPQNVELKSIDRNIVHAKLTTNGMHFVIVATGKSNSVMMQRVCVGGSRLEDASCAGAAHVIEHMDFRNMDWNAFGGINKNASTCKTNITHQAYMLLDPKYGHLQKELEFQKNTMLGHNLKPLSKKAIYNEIQNVRDEGMYNNQMGSGFRAVVEQMDEMMLKRVWEANAHTKPTIGTEFGLSNLKTAKDLLDMHHMIRTPERTYMVMCGPIDVNKALHLLQQTFLSVPRRVDSMTRPIPQSIQPGPAQPAFSSITLDSGNRFINIGGVHGAYNADTDVMMIMTHLVNMLGSNPAVEQLGVSNVCLYAQPQIDAGVFSLIAQVAPEGDENKMMTQAQQVLEQNVIIPLLQFQDDQLLNQILQQYRQQLTETLQSGPQKCCALAVEGILACGKPSLAWHVDERFTLNRINAARVRQVAANMFHPNYIGIVHCTAHSTRAPAAIHTWSASNKKLPYFHTKPDISHLEDDIESTAICQYVHVNPKSLYNKENTLDAQRKPIATVAYNTTQMQPLNKRSLTCYFGTPSEYGGWAQANLLVAALNSLAEVSQSFSCSYKLEDQQIIGTVESRAGMDFTIDPLLASLSLSAAVASNQPSAQLDELRMQLPQACLQRALQNASEWYETPSQQAMAQTRSQICKVHEDGFVPSNLETAAKLLGAEHQFVLQSMTKMFLRKPKLACTNICRTHAHQIATALNEIKAKNTFDDSDSLKSPLSVSVPSSLHVVHKMSGLHTYPYVASMKGKKKLDQRDRAALLVSNHVMCGGMGAHYTHSIRQLGISYRPTGSVQLSWNKKPVLLLNATFDKVDKDSGRKLTLQNIQDWCTGNAQTFTDKAVQQAKQTMKEQVLLYSMEFDSQKYALLACLDENKYSTEEVLRAVQAVQASDAQRALHKYFGDTNQTYESWVI